MARDLEGVLVVSLEQAVAAPLASRLLADAGARVIKIERPEGDFARRYDDYVAGESANFVWLNRGKQSIVLDLREQEDRDLLLRMLARADVFIQNLAPGATERLGLGSKSLRERFPQLVTCDISGYGSDGPLRDMKAYDLLVQAESGLAWVTGIEDCPTRVGVSVCDIGAGMEAYAAILRALLARVRTGRGQGIEVSLFHTIGEWMNIPYLCYRYGGLVPPRLGLHHPFIAPYGLYRCADGEGLLVAVQNDREWRRFCSDIVGDSALAEDPRFATNTARVRHRRELDAILEPVFARLPRADMAVRLQAAGIAWSRLSTLADLLVHPQLRTIPVRLECGETIEMLAPGARFSDTGESSVGQIPRLDEHGAVIRAEFAAAEKESGGGR
ncbi:Acetyl-CoA:oxalate CoA-transferase [bacterium HR40]|nr:Acetyl-CoA:oxalate CoA-transferase [bacterium HR40]